jgi:hypothetical protein
VDVGRPRVPFAALNLRVAACLAVAAKKIWVAFAIHVIRELRFILVIVAPKVAAFL